MPTMSRQEDASASSVRRQVTEFDWVIRAYSWKIERDLRGGYGDELVFGGGKSMREGMGMDNQVTRAGGAPDLVITNVTVIDAVLGEAKVDVGIKDGRISAIGKSGQSADDGSRYAGLGGWSGHRRYLRLASEFLDGTCWDRHTDIHSICPQQAEAALSNGTTTLIGGGTGPSDGS